MIPVATHPTRADAELAQATLEAAGINSVIASDPFDLSGGARILFAEADAEFATEILATEDEE